MENPIWNKRINTPVTKEEIRRLVVGDIVYLSGIVVTARDQAHNRIMSYLKKKKRLPFTFDGGIVYHCGPLVKKNECSWKVLAAGPTTSMRMEPFAQRIIKELGIRFIIGKGGMGKDTRIAMKKFGVVYGAFTGGTAVLAARSIRKVKKVDWLDLGIPDAVWTFNVEMFGPLIISIDSHGNSLYEEVHALAKKRMELK